MVKLPTKKSIPEVNPKKLVIFSKPKTGKTTVASKLENSLIFDLEKGTRYVEALKVEINNLSDLKAYGKEILDQGKPYKYIIVDTVSKLEDLVLSYAAQLYKKTPMGAKYQGNDVRTLPNGAGYLYWRTAFFNTLEYIYTLSEYTILLGHLKDSMISKKGEEFSALELDLTGKIKSILSADVDAIGYFYRKDGKGIINFNSSEEIICGARSNHLKNAEIVLSDYDEESQKVKTYWDRIYI